MRFLPWLCGCGLLCAGCALVVSFDGFADGASPITSTEPDAGLPDAPIDVPETSSGGPIVVRSVLQKLRGIAVGRDDLYWIEGAVDKWGIYRVSKGVDGGAAAEVARGTSVYDVTVTDGYLYWSDGSNVGRAPLGDASVAASYTDTGVALSYLAVDSIGRIFASTPDGIVIGPCIAYDKCKSADPVEGKMFFSPLGRERTSGIAVVDDLLFWGHDAPGVARANRSTLDTSPRAELDYQMPAEPVSGVATDGTKVYWIAGDRAILATPVAGSPTAPVRVCDDFGDDAGFGANADLAVDGEWVYFTRPSVGLIQKCKKAR